MSEDNIGPRGKRLLYSRFFSGGIHRDDFKHLEEFKYNCSRKESHMNYDGKKESCGWSILLKRNNKIEEILIPIALTSGINADIFIDEVLDEFLENIKTECTNNNLSKELGSLRKSTISKTVSNVIENQL